MSASDANDSVLNYSEQMKRGEYKQGRVNWKTAVYRNNKAACGPQRSKEPSSQGLIRTF
jgi:hypothetical protein